MSLVPEQKAQYCSDITAVFPVFIVIQPLVNDCETTGITLNTPLFSSDGCSTTVFL